MGAEAEPWHPAVPGLAHSESSATAIDQGHELALDRLRRGQRAARRGQGEAHVGCSGHGWGAAEGELRRGSEEGEAEVLGLAGGQILHLRAPARVTTPQAGTRGHIATAASRARGYETKSTR